MKSHRILSASIIVLTLTLLAICLAVPTAAQDDAPKYTEQQYKRALNQLDSRPFDPALDPDIDMFMGNWRNSMPR